MSIRTYREIRNNVADTARESSINSLIDDYINLTLMEINDPGWAYAIMNKRVHDHLWSFNRRKHTFSTVSDQESYNLPRDLDKIALIRQTTTPVRLLQVPDDIFYRYIPNPTTTGNPRYYRLWEEEGLSTSLSADDTVDVVSSSASDTNQTISVVGYDNNGIRISETYTLNGTTTQAGSKTFDARKPIRVSKSASTTGNITVTENSGGTTLLVMGPEERSPRFKVISLYPIPSSAITMSLEYYTRIRRLVNAEDVPDIDEKWIWVVRMGALAKVYRYQNKENDTASSEAIYASGVRAMVAADMQEPDFIPVLRSQNELSRVGIRELSDNSYSAWF